MNTLLRHGALLLCGLLLAVPIITLPGAFHLLILAVSVYLLGRRLFTPGVWPLWTLGLYTLFVGSFYVAGLEDWKEINSQQMRQVSMLLLTFYAMRRATRRELHVFFAGVLLTAVVGVVAEMRGVDTRTLLPRALAGTEFATDVGFLSDGAQRFHGTFSEASILLATTTGYVVIVAFGTLALWRRVRDRPFLLLTTGFGVLALLFLLGVTLAKTGIVLALGAGFGWLVAVVRYAPRRRTLGLLAAGVSVALLAAIAFALLPASKRDYFINDVRSLPAALEGNSKLEATSSGGLLTRVQCWRIAGNAVTQHPLGVGLFGVPKVVAESNNLSLTGELRYLFGMDIYGLKNALANVIAQAGLPGLALLMAALWQCFLRPLRLARQNGWPMGQGPAAVYLAGFFVSLLFLATCESYYWMAFPIVLRCYADAVIRERDAQEFMPPETDEAAGSEDETFHPAPAAA